MLDRLHKKDTKLPGGIRMSEDREQYWNTFLKTGSAIDYLQYVSARQCTADEEERSGTDSYEQSGNRDGDGFAGISSGRL